MLSTADLLALDTPLDASPLLSPSPLAPQARRFLEEGSLLRLVVTFKGGGQIALGRDVTLYLIGQLAGA